jgi:modification methylase
MPTQHRIIIGNSQQMPEVADGSVQLMVTSPPYPMIQMWDTLFTKGNRKVAALWRKLDQGDDAAARKIYDLMHENLSKVWAETYRVLADGAIAAINIGDATRNINGNFQLFPNHARITEACEKIGFTTLPYILWKKPTNRPKYKGKGAFLGSGFLPPNAYVTLDCEFILLFRKGKLRKFEPHHVERYESQFTKTQRDVWFSQIWDFKGTRQTASELERRTAAYPDEVAERLIRMFSVRGETVLDPFLGSGTTAKVAILNDRNSVGYEADSKILSTITAKVEKAKIDKDANVTITKRA